VAWFFPAFLLVPWFWLETDWCGSGTLDQLWPTAKNRFPLPCSTDSPPQILEVRLPAQAGAFGRHRSYAGIAASKHRELEGSTKQAR
jgi:hypothetical protein